MILCLLGLVLLCCVIGGLWLWADSRPAGGPCCDVCEARAAAFEQARRAGQDR
jgi:hypothetical protein